MRGLSTSHHRPPDAVGSSPWKLYVSVGVSEGLGGVSKTWISGVKVLLLHRGRGFSCRVCVYVCVCGSVCGGVCVFVWGGREGCLGYEITTASFNANLSCYMYDKKK